MEHIYVTLYRTTKTGKWQPFSEGVFDERRLAENFLEIKKAQGYDWEMAIIDGPIFDAHAMEAYGKALGEF